ncbi:unnamed protein product [marine sediment metagenome]|uniref:Uncharacterized protein n=1 Tax=marine sediment metagenome TaxID=412755 RepID=X0X0Z2_9ZZZZ
MKTNCGLEKSCVRKDACCWKCKRNPNRRKDTVAFTLDFYMSEEELMRDGRGFP